MPFSTGRAAYGFAALALAATGLGACGSPGRTDAGGADAAPGDASPGPDGGAGTDAATTGFSAPMNIEDWVPRVGVDALGAATVEWVLDTGTPFSIADVTYYTAESTRLEAIPLGLLGTTWPDVPVRIYDAFGGLPPSGAVEFRKVPPSSSSIGRPVSDE